MDPATTRIIELRKAIQLLRDRPRQTTQNSYSGPLPSWKPGQDFLVTLGQRIMPAIRDACDKRVQYSRTAFKSISQIILDNWEDIVYGIEDLVHSDMRGESLEDSRYAHHLAMTTFIKVFSFDSKLSDTLFRHPMTGSTVSNCFSLVGRVFSFIGDLKYAQGCVVVEVLTVVLAHGKGAKAIQIYWQEADWAAREALVGTVSYRLSKMRSLIVHGYTTVSSALMDTLSLLVLFEFIALDKGSRNTSWEHIDGANGFFNAISCLYHILHHPSIDLMAKYQVGVLSQRVLEWICSFPEDMVIKGLRRAFRGGALSIIAATGGALTLLGGSTPSTALPIIYSYLEHLEIARPLSREVLGLSLDSSAPKQLRITWNRLHKVAETLGEGCDVMKLLVACHGCNVRTCAPLSSSYTCTDSRIVARRVQTLLTGNEVLWRLPHGPVLYLHVPEGRLEVPSNRVFCS